MERSRGEMEARLHKQIQFIVEVDKVKNIFRQTYLADANRLLWKGNGSKRRDMK